MLPEHLVLFDGVCNLCNSSVSRIIRNDKKGIFHFASLQSETGQKISKEYSIKSETIVYLRYGKVFLKSSAALRIASRMNFPYPLLAIFLIMPWFIRDIVYDFIAKRRYKWFGKTETCMIPEPGLKNRFID